MNYNEAYKELYKILFPNGEKWEILETKDSLIEDLFDEIIKNIAIKVIRGKHKGKNKEMFWELFDYILNNSTEKIQKALNTLEKKGDYEKLFNILFVIERLDDNLQRDAVEHLMDLKHPANRDFDFIFRIEGPEKIKLAVATSMISFYRENAEATIRDS